MDFKEIREKEKKFNGYVEDAFTRVGKNMLKEYKENKEAENPKLNKEEMETLADYIFTIQLATSMYSTKK